MILDKLIYAETTAQKEDNRLLAIKSVREILKQIDFSAEVLPEEEPERMVKLLFSLKGEPLSGDEINLVYEMARIE